MRKIPEKRRLGSGSAHDRNFQHFHDNAVCYPHIYMFAMETAEILVHNWSYDDFRYHIHGTFSQYICHCAWIWEKISLSNSGNFLQDEWNDYPYSFFWVWDSPFGVVDTWWVNTQKDIPSEYKFSIGTILVCRKTLPIGCAQDTRKSTVVALALPTLETTGMFHYSRVPYQDFYGFDTGSVEMRCI